MTPVDAYNDLRKYVSRFPLLESLDVVRSYLQYFQFDEPLPAYIEFNGNVLKAGREGGIFEWTLEILARELVLHAADYSTQSLRQWSSFANVMNKIHGLEDAISAYYPELYTSNILIELYRIAHRQFPWQRRPSQADLLRYYKIFGGNAFDPIIQNAFGVNAQQLFMIGLVLTMFFVDRFAFELPPKIEGLPISLEEFNHVASRVSIDLGPLRHLIAGAQSLDHDFAYTFDPIRSYPLLRAGDATSGSLLSPIPTFIFRRFTEGIYYDICSEPGFSDAFGPAFQSYVGEVVQKADLSGRFVVKAEAAYQVRKDRKDSVDWIVSDDTADLFVECKTKKLRYGAKMGLASTEVLREDLNKMATFLVQVYKTLNDALNGLYQHWEKRDKPVYPVVVTLEEWFAFGDKIVEALDKALLEAMAAANLDSAIIEAYPYTICAVEDFELAIQVMGQTGIAPVMRERVTEPQRLWHMPSLLSAKFRKEVTKCRRNLFEDDLGRIHPLLGRAK
jgi:hypothetical protein